MTRLNPGGTETETGLQKQALQQNILRNFEACQYFNANNILDIVKTSFLSGYLAIVTKMWADHKYNAVSKRGPFVCVGTCHSSMNLSDANLGPCVCATGLSL